MEGIAKADERPDPVVVTDAEALAELCGRLRQQPVLALDTEFERVRTYFPKLCLMQVGNPALVACIDPLAIDSLTPVLDVLFDPELTKVLHAGRQDLELIFQLAGRIPQPLFDTQIAARLVGFDEQIGYASLVKELLGVSLDKDQTRTDWARRPLSREQLLYAADDVRYLVEVHAILIGRLEEMGRLEWALEDSAELTRAALYEVAPADAARRIRGGKRLSGRSRPALVELAAWREREAVRSDRPRKWVLRDEPLLDMARLLPKTAGEFARIPGMSEALVKRFGDDWLVAIERSQTGQVSAEIAGRDPDEDRLLAQLQRITRRRAGEHEVSPSALATRRDLKRLIRGERQVPVLTGWRYPVIGRELLAILSESNVKETDGTS